MAKLIRKGRRVRCIKKGTPETPEQQMLKWELVRQFFGECQRLYERNPRTDSPLRRFLWDRHYEVFGVVPSREDSPALVKSRLIYHYQHEGFRQAGRLCDLSPDFLQNYRAAMSLFSDLSEFTPSVHSLLRVLSFVTETVEKHDEKNGQTVLVEERRIRGRRTRKVKEADKKNSVRAFLLDLFWNNNKTKYTDEQIQKMVLDRWPEKEGFRHMGNVTRERGALNAGKIAEFGLPPKPILRYQKNEKK